METAPEPGDAGSQHASSGMDDFLVPGPIFAVGDAGAGRGFSELNFVCASACVGPEDPT
jgi:hypothetical protein